MEDTKVTGITIYNSSFNEAFASVSRWNDNGDPNYFAIPPQQPQSWGTRVDPRGYVVCFKQGADVVAYYLLTGSYVTFQALNAVYVQTPTGAVKLTPLGAPVPSETAAAK
ncbi:hypothetical protein [Burkholderia lata]|uniref:Lipoprotein n=1 Tax=Burkholderia lata (strain ATCC 17760 / DSM 23089 / LMG 22485 / NCIMB 9086 / R18194 / 383) TaxID=482957 RepID=Q395V0_BURL3|nr:hypothetical protein [Burkholderia lata]ABB11761.1 hypothetical protein Bcep18194_B1647 [Burkholderia lata]